MLASDATITGTATATIRQDIRQDPAMGQDIQD